MIDSGVDPLRVIEAARLPGGSMTIRLYSPAHQVKERICLQPNEPTLNISVDMSPDAVKTLLGDIDTKLLDAVGIVRQATIVHVHQGHDLGVYNTGGLSDPGAPESARVSGAAPDIHI